MRSSSGSATSPSSRAEAWQAVARSTAAIAVATYEGRRRNPVRLHRTVWPLLPAVGDEGARTVARLRPDLVEEVPCPGSPADIDTVSDLQNAEVHRPWQNRSSTNSP
jgi:molybdenum cofactor cytidylyltransferase